MNDLCGNDKDIFYQNIIFVHINYYEYIIKTFSLNNCSLGHPRDDNTN